MLAALPLLLAAAACGGGGGGGSDIPLPATFGVYAVSGAAYREVPRRTTAADVEDLGMPTAGELGLTTTAEALNDPRFGVAHTKTSYTIANEQFVAFDAASVSGQGFVIIGEAISEVVLLRVPHDGAFSDNETRPNVTTSYVDSWGDESRSSEAATTLGQSKDGATAYHFTLAEVVPAGLYLIDYKSNGTYPPGNWNAIRLQ